MRTLGVDGCSKGWVAVANDGRAYFGRSIDQLLHRVDLDGVVDVVAIDIPIGLPASHRAADVLARAELGPRRSSVFTTPVRSAVYSDHHQAATAEAGMMATPDDILDAAVACWSALRHAERRSVSFPTVPEHFSDGLAAAIWA